MEEVVRAYTQAGTQVSPDHSVPCSSTNEMPFLGSHNSPLVKDYVHEISKRSKSTAIIIKPQIAINL